MEILPPVLESFQGSTHSEPKKEPVVIKVAEEPVVVTEKPLVIKLVE